MPAKKAPPGEAREKRRTRAFGHRWAAAVRVDDSVVAVGVRFDEEDAAVAESSVVRMGPAKAELLATYPKAIRAVAVADDGCVAALDVDGGVWVGAAQLTLPAVSAIAGAGACVVAATSDALWRVTTNDATRWQAGGASVVAATADGVVAAASDDRVVVRDGAGGVVVDVAAPVAFTALALGASPSALFAVRGAELWSYAGGAWRVSATAAVELHAVAVFRDQVFVGSRAGGLFTLDGAALLSIKPSVRAHGLHARSDALVAVSDIYVAVSDDGSFFDVRDLSPYTRLAEARRARGGD